MNARNIMVLRYTVLSLALCAALVTAGCADVRDTLGLHKQSPDEFHVVKRAPLELPPPDFTTLPVPRPGMQRPQEKSAKDRAQTAVFGEALPAAEKLSGGEQALLEEAGANVITPHIRSLVDQETEAYRDRNKPVAQKLLGIGGDPDEISATVVDAEKEAARLKANKEKGLSPTDGETPSIED